MSADHHLIANNTYKKYWLVILSFLFTGGATWGAVILWKIGFNGSFTSVAVNEINAHGSLMIYGWVGLAVMASLYQLISYCYDISLDGRMPMLVLSLVVSGLVLELFGSFGGLFLFALGAVLQILGTCLFACHAFIVYHRFNARKTLTPSMFLILMGLIWFVLSVVSSSCHYWNILASKNKDDLLWYVKTYQAPLRDIQVHGMALFIILGVATSIFPQIFGLKKLERKKGWIAIVLLMLGVSSEVIIFILYHHFNDHRIAAFLIISWSLILFGVSLILYSMNAAIISKDRSYKWVCLAFIWLELSLLMLLFLPLYSWLSGLAFSHAYYGAIRHAVTVGFVSLMIMVMAPKITSFFDEKSFTSSLPFVLVNIGCFLRVLLQILTDWSPQCFQWVGISSVFEISGLLWWALGFMRMFFTFNHLARLANQAPDCHQGNQAVSA